MPLYGLQTRGIDEEEYSLNDTDTDFDYLTKLNYSDPEARKRIIGGTICRRGFCPWQVRPASCFNPEVPGLRNCVC